MESDPLAPFDPHKNPHGFVRTYTYIDFDAGVGYGEEKAAKPSDDDDEMTVTVIASDESVDSMRDIIRADGWDFARFKANPMVLRQHNHNFIVGEATDVWQRRKQTFADLELAEPGTSRMIDETRSLIRQKKLRAVSVGFIPQKWAWMDDGGIDFQEQELTEISFVAVGANPNALAVKGFVGRDEQSNWPQVDTAQQRAHRPRQLEATRRLISLA